MRQRTQGLVWAVLFLALVASQALAAIATTTLRMHGTPIMRAQVLTSAVALTDGEWIDVSGLQPISVHVMGITTATVEVDGSNEATRPANSTHGIKINAGTITADTHEVITRPLRWLKVRVTAYTSGTIHGYLEGHGR